MDLQAFILCGQGTALSPFTQTRGDTGLPKALLPVANRHMIEYVLDWCEQASFREIAVVAEPEELEQIQKALKPYMEIRKRQHELLAKHGPTVSGVTQRQPVPLRFVEARYDTTGAILQRELLPCIKGDFVLLPCDFVTEIPPQIFIDQFRNKDPDNLAMAVLYRNTFEIIDKKPLDISYTVYSENDDSVKQPVLLDSYSKDDVDKSKYLQIRSHLLWRYPNASVSKKLLNASIYFCSKELVELLAPVGPFSAISETESDNDEDTAARSQKQQAIHPIQFRAKNELIKDPINCNKSLSKLFRDLARRSWQHSTPRETVGLFILPSLGSFIRSNILNAYMEANRYMLRVKSLLFAAHSTPTMNNAVGADSIVGANCTILERTSVKLSVLGKNCQIGKRCRIVGSVILDNVEIEDECVLENVIVGSTSKVGKKCRLTNSYIEGSYTVNAKTVLKGETLTHIYLEESDQSSESAGSSEEEDSSDYSEADYDEEFEDDGLFER
ncbi:LANO_0H16556g1_1 [Lachancea nothofagi CBS 11611]|uniref:Translation initiation factor eIF2B subunit gamma n=1 Tax=Lachancea nothofagi CBS 11611 TaxID=1266666 RepID=A0A1G4KN31_9SACH|nr:LANO_0H16556g1_1 [Lachancea nothofagi CBS 11611]